MFILFQIRFHLIFVGVVGLIISLLNIVHGESVVKEGVSSELYYRNVRHRKEMEEPDTMECHNNDTCVANYTVGIDYALKTNSTLVHLPFCNMSNGSDGCGVCTCGEYCLSRSLKSNNEMFYYCGPCNRVGSVCNGTCTGTIAVCVDGYCSCKDGGTFYELYYCYIPYYGYEVALQMAITTCIVIAFCLLVASVYNAVGFRRLRQINGIRQLFGGENGTRESPPDDTPPKYDDVIVEELPSYQDALKMSEDPEDIFEDGIVNLGFEDDVSANNNNNNNHINNKKERNISVSNSYVCCRCRNNSFIASNPAVTETTNSSSLNTANIDSNNIDNDISNHNTNNNDYMNTQTCDCVVSECDECMDCELCQSFATSKNKNQEVTNGKKSRKNIKGLKTFSDDIDSRSESQIHDIVPDYDIIEEEEEVETVKPKKNRIKKSHVDEDSEVPYVVSRIDIGEDKQNTSRDISPRSENQETLQSSVKAEDISPGSENQETLQFSVKAKDISPRSEYQETSQLSVKAKDISPRSENQETLQSAVKTKIKSNKTDEMNQVLPDTTQNTINNNTEEHLRDNNRSSITPSDSDSSH